MNIQILSDLHLEFFNSLVVLKSFLARLVPDKKGDVLVLAGDITVPNLIHGYANGLIALDYLSEHWDMIFYVPGNHEYYHGSFEQTHNSLDRLVRNFQNVTILNNDVVDYKGRRFLGTTLWFPDRPDNPLYFNTVSDFESIKDKVERIYQASDEALDFLCDVREGDIVITHHLPSYNFEDVRFRGRPSSRFFVNENAENILYKNPKLWIHGHAHSLEIKQVGPTTVIRNPYGYYKEEEVTNFIPRYSIKLYEE